MEREELVESVNERLNLVSSQPDLLHELLEDIVELEETGGFESDTLHDSLFISLFEIGAKSKDQESLEYILDLIESFDYQDSWDITLTDIYPEFFDSAQKYFPEMLYEIGSRVDKNLYPEDYTTYYDGGYSEVYQEFLKILPYMPGNYLEKPDPEVSPQVMNLDYVLDLINSNDGDNRELDEKYIEFLMEEDMWLELVVYKGSLNRKSVKRFFIWGLDYLLEKNEQEKYERLMELILGRIELQLADLYENLLFHLRTYLVKQEEPYDLLSGDELSKDVEENLRKGKKLFDSGDNNWLLIAPQILTDESLENFSKAHSFEEIFSQPSEPSSPTVTETETLSPPKKSYPQSKRGRKPYRPKGLKGCFYDLYKILYGKKK